MGSNLPIIWPRLKWSSEVCKLKEICEVGIKGLGSRRGERYMMGAAAGLRELESSGYTLNEELFLPFYLTLKWFKMNKVVCSFINYISYTNQDI